MEVNDIKLFTAQPGSILIRNCHRTVEECRTIGGQRNFQPASVIRIPISGRVHIGIMHESYFMIRIRVTHDGEDGQDKFNPSHVIRKSFGESTASFIHRFRLLAGADREIENINWYNYATNSLFNVSALPITKDPMILYEVSDDEPFLEHSLYSSNSTSWSREFWLKIPAQYSLTSKGPCFFPFLNLREDLTLEITLATNEQLFQPFTRGSPGVFSAMVGDPPVQTTVEIDPARQYTTNFVSHMHNWRYEVLDFYYLLSGINLDLGAEVNVADWHFDCIETNVMEMNTSGGTWEEVSLPIRRTSVQSIRAFFVDPKAMLTQNFSCCPKYCYPEGGYSTSFHGRVTWYGWFHGSQVWPTAKGTGDRFAEAFLWNSPLASFAAQVYQKEIAASMNLDSHALSMFEGLRNPTSFNGGQISWTGEYSAGLVNWSRGGWRGATPFWHSQEYAMFGTYHPEYIHVNPPYWSMRQGLGGKFMMFATFGPMTNDSGVVQGRNTFQDAIRLQWVRENALPIGSICEYGASEKVYCTQNAPNLICVAHSILSLSVSGGLILAARCFHYFCSGTTDIPLSKAWRV